MKDYLENNSTQCLLSPRRERIEVRGYMIWTSTSTPTLALPRRRGRGIGGNQFSWFVGDEPVMKDCLGNIVTVSINILIFPAGGRIRGYLSIM